MWGIDQYALRLEVSNITLIDGLKIYSSFGTSVQQ